MDFQLFATTHTVGYRTQASTGSLQTGLTGLSNFPLGEVPFLEALCGLPLLRAQIPHLPPGAMSGLDDLRVDLIFDGMENR